MLRQIWTNLRVHFKFYRRNRLLLVIALIFLALAGLSLVFSLLFASKTGRFEIVREAVERLQGFALVFVGGLGLFLISSHLHNRSLKMVLTKPCLPETWLGSVFLAAWVVALVLYACILGFGVFLCLVWRIPVQSGFLFITAESLVQALIVMAYLTFLSMVMHPVPAVLIALLLNEGTFYGLRFALLAAIRTTGGNLLLPWIEKGTYAIYMVLPVFQPYSEKTEGVHASLRAVAADWSSLLRMGGYMLTVVGLFYCLADFALRRKNLM